MNTNNPQSRPIQQQFIQDKWFWLVIAAAPCVWWVMWWVFDQPVTLAGSLSWVSLLTLILVYPVLEEIVFRGALQGWLLTFKPMQARFAELSLANLFVSLAFTALHFINHSPLWAVLVFGPSLVFGWARDRFKSVVPPIVLHVFYNAGFLLLFG